MSGGVEQTAKMFAISLRCRICGYTIRTPNPFNRDCCFCFRDGNRFTMHEIVETKNDPVNHPKHYTSHPSGIECIEITRHMTFNCGNAVKYIWRMREKGGLIEDLEKAKWYIDDEIKRLKETKMDRTGKSSDPELCERGTQHRSDDDGA